MGYSELFSLSKEDVLEGCRDYPEAERKLYEYAQHRLGYEKTKREASEKVKTAFNTLTSIASCLTQNPTMTTTTTASAPILNIEYVVRWGICRDEAECDSRSAKENHRETENDDERKTRRISADYRARYRRVSVARHCLSFARVRSLGRRRSVCMYRTSTVIIKSNHVQSSIPFPRLRRRKRIRWI